MKDEKLGAFLREVSNWQWDEFVKAERDETYTTNEAIIFALVRSCVMQKMEAIRMSLNRLDGRLKTPIKIEYPKMYFLFPNATAFDAGVKPLELRGGKFEKVEIITGLTIVEPEPEADLPSMSLRETLALMSGYPRRFPAAVAKLALETEQWLNGQGPEPDEIPRVKSVVTAHLLLMAQNRDITAISEVFDQLDGKLVETIQILGKDIQIINYSSVAPEGAYLNEDGVLQLEAIQAQNSWALKLGRDAE